jgi:8-hydroxy-5-deazaflavin:NADPH oxidoreductase
MTAQTLGFLGGTGPQGRGLGLRLGQAGHRILIGSRTQEKAAAAVEKVHAKDPEVDVRGVTNDVAATEADIVFVVVPYSAQQATLAPLAGAVGSKLVVSCANNLTFDAAGPVHVPVPAGSAAAECAQLLPDAVVVGAFQNVSATKLLRVPDPVEADVLVVGDDEEARVAVCALADQIPGMRGIEAGPLRLAAPIEDLTAVLLAVNKRRKTHAGIRLTGV